MIAGVDRNPPLPASMKNSFSSPQVVCRPALPRDTTDILEFTKTIWHGHDYIKYVWHDWLADPKGILAIAEYNGRAVGMAKLTFASPGQWWLEGFRVDPNLQGLKIGSHIHEYIDQWWFEHCDGVIRLMTSGKNTRVHHLSERLDYEKVGEVIGHYEAAAIDRSTNSFQAVKIDEIKSALEFARESQTLRLSGLMDIGWTQVYPDENILSETISKDNAFWWCDYAGLILAWDDDDDEGNKILGIGLPACDIKSLPEFLIDIRQLAAQKECKDIFWIAPSNDKILSALKSADFETDWDDPAFVYEKKHPG